MLAISAVLIAGNINAQQSFTITGQASDLNGQYIYLMYSGSENRSVKDSIKVKQDGSFILTGSIPHPTVAWLSSASKLVGDDDPNKTAIWLDPGQMTVSLRKNAFKTAVITGSESQRQYAGLQSKYDEITQKMKSVSDEYQKEKNPEKKAAIRDKLEPFLTEYSKADEDFIKKYPQSYVTAFQLRFLVSSQPLEVLEKYYAALGSKIQESVYAKAIARDIAALRRGSPGAVAAVFSKPDLINKSFNLADFKGKSYILIDFWASWCVPCRKGNPHLRELYTKYKDKGFEIVGVSDDDSRPDAWRKAIEVDSIGIWRHVLRGFDMDKRSKGLENPDDVSDLYGIHTLPTKILIDKNGVIIGRYSSEEGPLDEKLKEIFGS